MDGQNESLTARHPSALLRLDSNPITVPINGFLMPLIALVTLVNNSLVLAILLRRQMRTPYGITQCYLPPDTSERATPNRSHAGWYSIYLQRRDGRLS